MQQAWRASKCNSDGHSTRLLEFSGAGDVDFSAEGRLAGAASLLARQPMAESGCSACGCSAVLAVPYCETLAP